MKIVVARRSGMRGEGLGNEILPWAKGWIASQVLDAHLIGPAWALNKRGYSRNFRTSHLDVIWEEALLHLPHFSFGEAEYRASGEGDFGSAIAQWARASGVAERRSYIVSVEGMWGGYGAIHAARPFLLSQMLASRDALRNIYRVQAQIDRSKLFVAVHMRAASQGFTTAAPEQSQRGMFNIAIPGDWYLSVCSALRRRFGKRVQFWFFTDRVHADFEEAVRRFNPDQLQPSGRTECSDLLLMAQADLRICSVSSYSLAAAFLTDGPYIWYEPQLTLCEGLYSLWGDEPAQKSPSSPTARSVEFVESLSSKGVGYVDRSFAGSAMDTGDVVPEHLAEVLEDRLRSKDPRTNLIEYGCLPQSLVSQHAENAMPGLCALAGRAAR